MEIGRDVPELREQGTVRQCRTALIDVTERKQTEDELRRLQTELEQRVADRTSALAMLSVIASMANQAASFEDAIKDCLKRLCKHDGWRFGHVWLPASDNPRELQAGSAWYATTPARYASLAQSLSTIRMASGEGPAGRVFASGKPECCDDVDELVSIYGSRVRELGIRTIGIFPVLVQDRPVGVLEFLSDRDVEGTEQLLSAMGSVGMLLGRVVEREQAAQGLHDSEQRLRTVLNGVPDAIVSMDRQGTIGGANAATERMFGYSENELIGKPFSLLVPSSDQEQHADYAALYSDIVLPQFVGGGQEMDVRRKDGTTFSAELEINEVEPQDLLVAIIHDISNRKALEKQVVDAATGEQRRIGQDIHDGIGQELTGLRYMAQTHAEGLAHQGLPEAEIAERMTRWLETVQRQLRSIIRELVPVELDEQGLVAALRGFADRTTEPDGDLSCTLESGTLVAISDTGVATQLFRIVQEAVGNAVRHAQASHITIHLSESGGMFRLQVVDDGIGRGKSLEHSNGIGLRTMAYRAGLIGARLHVNETAGGGTVVTCLLPKSNLSADARTSA